LCSAEILTFSRRVSLHERSVGIGRLFASVALCSSPLFSQTEHYSPLNTVGQATAL
jgi:hypothetical protein